MIYLTSRAALRYLCRLLEIQVCGDSVWSLYQRAETMGLTDAPKVIPLLAAENYLFCIVLLRISFTSILIVLYPGYFAR